MSKHSHDRSAIAQSAALVEKQLGCQGYGHHKHNHTLMGELECHVPYAIISVAFGLAILSILTFISTQTILNNPEVFRKGASMMFHSFHFMHIAFAASGTLITFMRFSKNRYAALVMGIFCPPIFCTLSDAVLPYLGGLALGVNMKFHLCFLTELKNIIPFLIGGIINGYILGYREHQNTLAASLFSHVAHITVSSLAAIFYLVSHGFIRWYTQIGFVFLFLIIAVVVPCTISDIIIPMVIARAGKKNEKHTA